MTWPYCSAHILVCCILDSYQVLQTYNSRVALPAAMVFVLLHVLTHQDFHIRSSPWQCIAPLSPDSRFQYNWQNAADGPPINNWTGDLGATNIRIGWKSNCGMFNSWSLAFCLIAGGDNELLPERSPLALDRIGSHSAWNGNPAFAYVECARTHSFKPFHKIYCSHWTECVGNR